MSSKKNRPVFPNTYTDEQMEYFRTVGRRSAERLTPEELRQRAIKANLASQEAKRRKRDERMKGSDPC